MLGATNRLLELDPALLRAGRFDRIIYVPPPDKEARKKIFQIYLHGVPSEVDYDALAEKTEGYTGADIELICRETKLDLFRSRRMGEKITTQDILQAVGRIRPSVSKEVIKEFEEIAHKLVR